MQLLTDQDLLHGAIYALEQGGTLLQDAVRLWEQKRCSSAVVLGVFAREELGRYRILIAEREQAKTLGPRDAKNVRDACGDHIKKMRQGITGTAMHFDAGDRDIAALRAATTEDERTAAQRTLDARVSKKRKREPEATHSLRKRALYVDFDPTKKLWNRPLTFGPVESGRLLEDVANDYSRHYRDLLYDRFVPQLIELGAAFDAWPNRPVLPEPIRPDLKPFL